MNNHELPLFASSERDRKLAAIVQSVSLSPDETAILSLIVGRGRNHPIQIKEIIRLVNFSERAVKQIVHDLRAVHLLPIASQRSAPAGYYWAESWADWQPYVEQYRAQAMDELTTLYRVTKHLWPEFAGQLRFEFEG
jgi:predicted DNA-binding transcriptional regulator